MKDALTVIILVVEDEVLIQTVLEDALIEGGYAVHKAFSGDEALRLLDQKGDEKFSALITDINLGSKVTGWDVARHAREIYPQIPVVYTTTANADEWAANGVPKSVLLTKPFASAQVVAAVSQLLNEASSVQSAEG